MIDVDTNNSSPEENGIFGLPYSIDDASLVIVPVPWDATSSQALASGGAPDAVYAASKYVELFDARQGSIYRRGIAMESICAEIVALNSLAIAIQDSDSVPGDQLTKSCQRLNGLVKDHVSRHLLSGKRVGLLGGDHSVSYGAIEAHLAQYPNLGILQIDAHCDLRRGFDGITFSHASIMYNVLESLRPGTLVQVGIRGLCEFEADYLRQSDRVHTYFDVDLHEMRAEGVVWNEICSNIAADLPADVYVSLDIDGLAPSNCPNTGTPVPGGLAYNDVVNLLRYITECGKSIVGFDLVEVSANEFDATIAAHLLYQLCGVVAQR